MNIIEKNKKSKATHKQTLLGFLIIVNDQALYIDTYFIFWIYHKNLTLIYYNFFSQGTRSKPQKGTLTNQRLSATMIDDSHKTPQMSDRSRFYDFEIVVGYSNVWLLQLGTMLQYLTRSRDGGREKWTDLTFWVLFWIDHYPNL